MCACSTQTGRITLSQLGEVLRTMDIDVESDEDVRSLLVGIGKCTRSDHTRQIYPPTDKL